jgi:hypothetical protein
MKMSENENKVLKTLVGKQVKALYYDEGKSKRVEGILVEATDRYLIVNDVVVGLGIAFIACIPQRIKPLDEKTM